MQGVGSSRRQQPAMLVETPARRRCRLSRRGRAGKCALLVASCVLGAGLRPSRSWVAPAPGPRGTYDLHASRAVLHLCLVPEPAPAAAGIPGPGLPKDVRPLGLFGRTVGGSFAVEWDRTPFGCYREVGLLSSLVASSGDLSAWGGWASHVWVDSDEAAEGGRRIWGLPTSNCKINAETAGADGKVLAYGDAPLISIGDGVGPLGRIDTAARITVGSLPWDQDAGFDFDGLELPNLSGCLPSADPEDVAAGLDCRQLLSYPISLDPQSVRILPGCTPTGGSGVVPRLDFSSWLPLCTVELRDVDVAVGIPKAI